MAQQPNYLFHHIGIKDGLNQENIYSVQQDNRGFLWIAAYNSLQRYDGHRFISFFTGKNGKLPGGVIAGMQIDKKNRLWLLTGQSSLGYFDTDNFTYHAVKVIVPDKYDEAVAALQVDKADNVILIYINRGIITYNEKNNEVAAKYNSFTIPAGWEPIHFWQDDALNYWISSNNGFLKYNSKKKLFSYRGHNDENDALIKAFEYVKSAGFIYSDKTNRFWLSYRQPDVAIKSFNTVNGEIKSWENAVNKNLKGAYFEVWGVQQFTDGTLWMHGPALLAQVNYEKNTVEPVERNAPGEYSIRYDQVNNLYEDREKSIWASSNQGLFRFNPSAQVFNAVNNRIPGESKTYLNDVTNFLETADGEILVSTWGEGIFCFDSNFNPITSKYVKRLAAGEGMVWSMIQRSNGDIWRGAQDGALFIYEAKTKQTVKLTPKEVNGRTIRQVAEDKNGDMWLGTQGGLLIKWSDADKQFSIKQKFKRLVSRLYVDSKNNIWACTDNDGVYCIKASDGSIITHYTSTGPANKTLLINGASDILQYNDSTMVIAANGLNILNTVTGNFTYWDEGAQIASMIKGKNDVIWLSTNIGVVSRLLKQESLHITFDARDGVNNFSFNSGAGIMLKNGRILFGTNHEFLTFDPAKAMNFDFKLPAVQLAGFALLNKWLPVDSIQNLKRLYLEYDENSFSIRFSNNCYQNLTPVFYMLENVDKEWKPVNSNGEVSFTYLAPGDYVLKAASNDGNGSSGKIISINISIAAPFYKTWWFYALLALLAGYLLFWLDRQRMKRKAAEEKMRTEIADDLHQQVNTTLNNINILSEMARLKADKDIEKSKEYIQQIHSKSNGMITALDDMLWGINPENDSMQKTIERFKEHIEALQSRFAVTIDLLTDKKVETLKLNMKLRQNVFWFLKSGSTNIIRTGGNNCNIHIGLEKTNLVYTLDFDSSNTDIQQLNNLLQRQELAVKIKEVNGTMNTRLHATRSLITLSIPVH
jgi:ligand-binding sensor domain-containing protein/signal transduction histidine kinase